jgi:hypothetical protein
MKLLTRLQSLEISLDQFCYSWFANYFASCLPTSCLTKIWDKIIGVGDDILPCYAFSLLELLSPKIYQLTTAPQVMHILMLVCKN